MVDRICQATIIVTIIDVTASAASHKYSTVANVQYDLSPDLDMCITAAEGCYPVVAGHDAANQVAG
jgi:hypothetical protein